MVFPVNFLIITLFRKARPRHKRSSRIQDAIEANKKLQNDRRQSRTSQGSTAPFAEDVTYNEEAGVSTISSAVRLRPTARTPGMVDTSDIDNEHQTEPGVYPFMDEIEMEKETNKQVEVKKKSKPFSLPWWFTIVAWFVLWATTLASLAFVLFYGVQFGDVKTKKWITSLLISFVTSIFLTQPLKV